MAFVQRAHSGNESEALAVRPGPAALGAHFRNGRENLHRLHILSGSLVDLNLQFLERPHQQSAVFAQLRLGLLGRIR